MPVIKPTEDDNPLARAFGSRSKLGPQQRTLRLPNLVVTEFLSEQRNLVVAGTVPQDEAYVVTLHLKTRPKGAISAEGRWFDPKNFVAGNAGIVDLRMTLASEYAGPFHYLSFYLRRGGLDRACDDAGAPRIGELRYQPGVGFSDPVLRHLLLSLRPALAGKAAELSTVYADHVALALVSHVAQTYGALRAERSPRLGGLTPSHERRAKELLDASLDGNVTLAELARVCELSVRQFTRAFRQSTGQSPHAWLTERRLDRAQGLLELTTLPLAEVAARTGFASQSHFTRVFTKALGSSPGAFRRLKQH
jgi:AraC-like DNA-binding protein